VAPFLSAEWIDVVRAAAPALRDATVECAVIGGPDGDVKFHAVGEEVALGALADADVSLTVPYPDSMAIARGELEPSVAFMQGRMKTAGDPGKLLDLLAATATPAFREGLERVASSTEF
jgi:putative sterol carrier protein